MDTKILTFYDTEIEKDKCLYCSSPVFLEDVDIDNILVSCKISFGDKNHSFL